MNHKNRIGKSLHADGITGLIVNDGIQKDGHYWKEAIIRDIVVGYVNADESKKWHLINLFRL